MTIVHLPQEQKDADDTVAAVQREGQRALSVAFDLEDFRGAHAVVDAHVRAFGAIDVLVNNASKQLVEPDFARIDLDAVESTFRTNILQMFALTKFALPHMHRGASVINTTSVTTFRGSPSMVDYVSTKGAIVGFTRALAKQLEPKGIVSPITLGPFPLMPQLTLAYPACQRRRPRTRTHTSPARLAPCGADGRLRREEQYRARRPAERDCTDLRLPRICRGGALLRPNYASVSTGRLSGGHGKLHTAVSGLYIRLQSIRAECKCPRSTRRRYTLDTLCWKVSPLAGYGVSSSRK